MHDAKIDILVRPAHHVGVGESVYFVEPGRAFLLWRPKSAKKMKKIKSPWYGVVWIVIWTAALIWFLTSGRFDERESIGLFLVWLVLVGTTVYVLIQRMRFDARTKKTRPVAAPSPPSLNAACQCGSGKKYKRCCGAAK